MANNKRRFISKTVGLSLGFLGIVGLVLSLVSLLPVNLYNIFITVNALTELLKYELDKNNKEDWWTLSPTATVYSVFLAGSIVSSLIVVILVLATCFRQGVHRSSTRRLPGSQRSTATAAATAPPQTTSSAGPSKAGSDLESHQDKPATSLWTSRVGALVFVGQIGWALFGTHLLFFKDAPILPGTVRKSTMISVLILWVNYLIVTVFSFILFCASFFIILGARRRRSRRRHRNTSYTPSSSSFSSGEEMQYHREETTPLLINMS